MTDLRKPLELFELPDWAKWFAWIEINPELKIQVLSLKYTRWDHSFYPIILNQDNQAVFELPQDLGAAVSDGRLWKRFPDAVYFSEEKNQITIDIHVEGDHPMPAFSVRQVLSPPQYIAESVENLGASYGPKMDNPAGDIPPTLKALSSDFKECTTQIFGYPQRQLKSNTPPWPIEKRRKKKT